jgi:hypothetical protein
MSKIMDWIDESPNHVVYVSIATMILLFSIFILTADISYTIGGVFFLLFLLSFICFLFSIARAIDLKNRSFWWFGLFILVPLIGLIVILALDDHSNEVSEIQQMR